MKFIRRVIWFVVFAAILGYGGSLYLAKNYENSLKVFAVKQINKQLAAEVDVDDVHLTVFKKFPFTSLEFTNVLAKDAIIKVGEQDTFFYFNRAYLQFNLIDILKNRFILREITLEEGFINPRVDNQGYDNYHIFKQTDSNTNDFLINLEKVNLENVHIDYAENIKSDRITFDANHAYLKGEFSKDEFELAVYGDFDLGTCTFEKKEWLANRHLDLDIGIYINNGIKKYEIRKGAVKIDKLLAFEIDGAVKNESKPYINLNVNGKKLDIVRTMALLPEAISEKLSTYESVGELTFKSNIEGFIGGNKTPKITADFSVKNGTIKTDNNVTLKEVNFSGSYGVNKTLDLKEMFFNLEGGTVSGDFKMTGEKYPLVTTSIVGEFDLAAAKKFLKLDTLSDISGQMKMNINYSGKIKDVSNLTPSDFKRAKTSGEVQIIDLNFSIKGSDRRYQNVNVDLAAHGNDMLINQLSGEVGGSDFSLKGIFTNMISFLLIDNQKLTVEADFKSKKLDFNELLSSEANNVDTTYTIQLPPNVNLNLRTQIGQVNFRRIAASDINGVVTYSNNKLKISPLSFVSMGGNLSGNALFYPLSSGNYRAVVDAEVKSVEVNTLFYNFENFGQEEIVSSNLKGVTYATIKYKCEFTDALEIIPASIYSNIDIAIDNGELIDFRPLYSVSDYIHSNKVLNTFIKAKELRKELEHIKFKTLRNQILIKNESITIPQMEINSSALNLVADGKHSFDNKINYHVNFYLAELLTKNKDRVNHQGRTQVYLRMTGTTENPVIEYEKNTTTEVVKEEVKKETQAVKQALKEEFGLFKNDTALKSIPEVEEKLEFAIEWDEDSDTAKSNKKESSNKTAKQRFLNAIKEKEKKNTDDFDFEDDDF